MAVTSFAQLGEDLLIASYLQKSDGVRYIDVGSLWPVEHSNSYFFYKRGGWGLCVDPNPDVADWFRNDRPRDIYAEQGAASKVGTAEYLSYENPVFNTCSADRARSIEKRAGDRPGRTVVSRREIDVTPIHSIIRETDFISRTDGVVDFMSVDVGGWELEVLEGFDIAEIRPRVVVCESLSRPNQSIEDLPVVQKMRAVGYRVAGFTLNTLYFADNA